MKKALTYFLVAVLAFGAPIRSFAAYAMLKPPPTWSAGMSAAVPGQTGFFKFGPAANGATFVGNTVLTNAALNVAGQIVSMPVAMRFAANAPRFAAAALWLNPALRFGLGAASLLSTAKMIYDSTNGKWKSSEASNSYPISDGFEYRYSAAQATWFVSLGALASATAQSSWFCQPPSNWASLTSCSVLAVTESNNTFSLGKSGLLPSGSVVNDTSDLNYPRQAQKRSTVSCPAGWYVTPAGCVQTPPPATVNREQFEDAIAPHPLPNSVPEEMPDVGWPVESPVINPDPSIAPQPYPSSPPAPRPLWIPTGDPQLNPNPAPDPALNPQPAPKPDTWTQPGIRVNPSPTPDSPWRVNTQPESITKPNSSPTPISSGQPDPTTAKSTPDSGITCGLPGTPKCAIDETGTPENIDKVYEQPQKDLDKAKDDIKAEIEKAKDIEAPKWNLTFQLPTGCAPYTTGIRGFIMNICQFQSTIHDLLSLIWVSTTAFVMIGMIGRAIREA